MSNVFLFILPQYRIIVRTFYSKSTNNLNYKQNTAYIGRIKADIKFINGYIKEILTELYKRKDEG
ncbi:hypothetical protein PB01_08180 [Psychrobacillus glaciei]|uniref:Uncharacterized protein n=1 Tax=Psychrobacillus glaciei TaxID=2283160 RepID=A0A5J6SM68_9BACI|nr:hypothetical protein PB01_08180 [Psychrobacillus glaciei]